MVHIITIMEKLGECWPFRMQSGRLALGINGFLELPPKRKGKRGWHSVANLSVLALNGTRKLVAVRKALQRLIGPNQILCQPLQSLTRLRLSVFRWGWM